MTWRAQLRTGALGVITAITGITGITVVVAGIRLTGSCQSQAAQVLKKWRRRSVSDPSAASRTVRAARTAQARPGKPPNGAESRPFARAHAFTWRARRAKRSCAGPSAARIAAASLTALRAMAAASHSSARRDRNCAGRI
nr:hypothetical protein [Nonomuraea aurantiaca]